MTERDHLPTDPPPASPLDDLASVLVDGEAAVEELARADEPEVAARMARFGEVAARVGEPVPAVTGAERDASVDAALAAWDDQTAQVAREDQLARRRARYAAGRRWLGAAAALVLVVGLGAVLARSSDNDDDSASDAATSETASAEAESPYDSGEASGGSDDSESEGGGDDSGAATSRRVVELGEYSDVDALLDAATAAQRLQPQAAESLPPDAAAAFQLSTAECDQDADGAAVEADDLVAVARLDGRQVAIVTESTGSELRLLVLAFDDCSVVATRAP